MTNTLPETIDVTNYIESDQFRPDSCEGRLDRLIKKKPLPLNSSYENQLQDKLEKWKTEYNNWLTENNRKIIDFNIPDLVHKTKYQYSYFQTHDPIDVYRTDLGIDINGNKAFKLFICIDNDGKIYSDYKEDGWIINSCDSVNSIIQDIYHQTE